MGTGEGANYKPWIEVGEIGSKGTAEVAIDWKTGRGVHLLSQGEVAAWYILRWDDENLDVREQYPLDKEETLKIAEDLGFKHPSYQGKPSTMTTDLLVTRKDGYVAYSVKYSVKEITDQRTAEKMLIEKTYWENRKDKWQLATRENTDMQKARNIRDVVSRYNVDYFPDDITLLKYLIAHKYVLVDMEHKLDYRALINTEEFKKWKTILLEKELISTQATF